MIRQRSALPAAQGDLKQRPVSAAIIVRVIIWDTIVENKSEKPDQSKQAGTGLQRLCDPCPLELVQ